MKRYDYLLVGAGLFNAVFAHNAIKKGKTCLVVEKRDHIAGNIFKALYRKARYFAEKYLAFS